MGGPMIAGKGLLLIALAVGYYVLIIADKEKKQTKLLGQIIGWIIIVASLLGIWCYVQQCIQEGGVGAACPFTGKMMTPPSSK